MSYYSEPDSNIRDNVKVLLGLPKHAIKKELSHDTCVGTCNVAAKTNFIALKAETEKVDINKLDKVLNE